MAQAGEQEAQPEAVATDAGTRGLPSAATAAAAADQGAAQQKDEDQGEGADK